MKPTIPLLLSALLASANPVFAGDEARCLKLDDSPQLQSSAELRSIAASCPIPDISYLYYQRAYHADLVHEGQALSGLIPHGRHADRYDFESYRMYMAMIEMLAKDWYPDIQERVKFLNAEYDRRGEIAELRLHGYHRAANQLERALQR